MRENLINWTLLLAGIIALCSLNPVKSSQKSVVASQEPKNRLAAKSLQLAATPDTLELPALPAYNDLTYLKTETLPAAPGTKSVLFNHSGTKLYAMNLEGMSVYEFDQASRKITREFKFKPTKGTGWDYSRNVSIPSWQEKPVEAAFSHGDKILWVSLHNAEGIVPIWVDSSHAFPATVPGQKTKPVSVTYPGSTRRDSMHVPLITTGKTPKVITVTNDNKYLLVSNWHSHTVSVLDLDSLQYPWGKVTHTLPVSAIPRGIVIDEKNRKTYVAIMGGSSLAVANNDTWANDTILNVASNPRHIVMDTSGHLFVSYNSLGQVACLDAVTGKTLFTAGTHAQPRTIVLSKNYKFLFVTCYSGNMVDVFKVNEGSFSKVASLPSSGSPVGVDIYENSEKLEAWVCNYSGGLIRVFTFKKNYSTLHF